MNEMADLIAEVVFSFYPLVPVVWMAGIAMFCMLVFGAQRRTYHSWLADRDASWTVRARAHLGLLGSWGFVVLALVAVAFALTVIFVDVETLRLWSRALVAALEG